MMKNLRTVKTGIIFGLVLVSMFAVFTPKVSAGPIHVRPVITISYPQQGVVIPNSGRITVNLTTSYTLSGAGSNFVSAYSLLKDTILPLQLKVEYKEDWVNAGIDNPSPQIKISEAQSTSVESHMDITITQQSPAFQLGKVTVSATSQEVKGLGFTIDSATYNYDIIFSVGYWPVVSYPTPRGNLLQTGPTNNADFEVDLDNLGNGVTKVQIAILGDIPEGWSVSIPSSVTLGSPVVAGSGASTLPIHLIIKPPYGFGFHNDVHQFQIQFTPSCEGSPGLVGQTDTLSFTVQSVGFSPGGGYEIPLIVVILVVIGIVLYLVIKFIKNRK